MREQSTDRASDNVAQKMRDHFLGEGWPPTVIISGENSFAKEQFIFETIAMSLFNARNEQAKTIETISDAMEKNEHPDFVYFPAEKIKIGDSSTAGTIRFLLERTLPRFPFWGNERFILFSNAAFIQDEAESALLKSLEEPRAENHFFLSIDDAVKLKDTIRSRSIEIPFRETIPLDQTPHDPWQKFWFFSGWLHSPQYQMLEEKNFLPLLVDFYSQLQRNKNDFDLFDKFFSVTFKKTFSKETLDTRTSLLKLAFLPFYFSCRDLLLEGLVPTIGPVRFSKGNVEDLIAIIDTTKTFFSRLSYRYYGTIAGNFDLIFFNFLDKLMPHWILKG